MSAIARIERALAMIENHLAIAVAVAELAARGWILDA